MAEGKTKFDLRFTSMKSQWKMVKVTASIHCLKLTVINEGKGVSEWDIKTDITLVDLCNFLNDLGAQGVRATCFRVSCDH